MRLALFMVLVAACDDERVEVPADAREELPAGVTHAPRGGGYCCPIDEGTCNCFRNGGWIQNVTDRCPQVCDLAPTDTSTTEDEHGCESLHGPNSCLGAIAPWR